MTLDEITSISINPALAWLPAKMDSDAARVMMLAIGLQESKFIHRFQVLNDPTKKGPARSFWQMEQGGGVLGVMTHHATRTFARDACAAHGVPFRRRDVWLAIESDDVLAAIFARLLLWSDPRALPPATRQAGADAWRCYIRNWRPGKPHPNTWGEHHARACEFVEAA